MKDQEIEESVFQKLTPDEEEELKKKMIPDSVQKTNDENLVLKNKIIELTKNEEDLKKEVQKNRQDIDYMTIKSLNFAKKLLKRSEKQSKENPKELGTETITLETENLKLEEYKKKYEKYKSRCKIKEKEIETLKNYQEANELRRKNDENDKRIAQSLVLAYSNKDLPSDVLKFLRKIGGNSGV